MIRPSSSSIMKSPTIFPTVFMSILLLISSLSLVDSFHSRSIQLSSIPSISSFVIKAPKQYISTQLFSNVDDETTEKKFYGFRSIAGQGVPSAALSDPLSACPPILLEPAASNPVTITPILTIPSVRISKSGFSDISSISSTSSPSFDSTLTFDSDKPKSQAIFTMLNRLKRLNYKFGLLKKLKVTTWDSPR